MEYWSSLKLQGKLANCARHDRLVDLIAAQILCVADEQIFKHTTVQPEWFNSPANNFF